MNIDPTILRMFIQLTLAAFLGLTVGVEREYKRKAAGMRTYALVSLGAALFTIISVDGFVSFLIYQNIDPTRIASQVVVGIGFIGAGLIFFRGDKVEGLTTAAALWVAAAIGVAVGIGMYAVAIFATLLTLLVVWGLRLLEDRIPRIDSNSNGE